MNKFVLFVIAFCSFGCAGTMQAPARRVSMDEGILHERYDTTDLLEEITVACDHSLRATVTRHGFAVRCN